MNRNGIERRDIETKTKLETVIDLLQWHHSNQTAYSRGNRDHQ